MKKTIVKISEGLGNQLFMYAHAYAFSKKMDYDLYGLVPSALHS